MASLSQWVGGARPRTLPTAVASVAVGTGLAVNDSSLMPVRAFLALLVAIALQVGVNYANDYSDGIKGTDEARVGPVRLVGQRLATPASVRLAAFMSFAVAAILGVSLWAYRGVGDSLREIRATGLTTLLNTQIEALDQWIAEGRISATVTADGLVTSAASYVATDQAIRDGIDALTSWMTGP